MFSFWHEISALSTHPPPPPPNIPCPKPQAFQQAYIRASAHESFSAFVGSGRLGRGMGGVDAAHAESWESRVDLGWLRGGRVCGNVGAVRRWGFAFSPLQIRLCLFFALHILDDITPCSSMRIETRRASSRLLPLPDKTKYKKCFAYIRSKSRTNLSLSSMERLLCGFVALLLYLLPSSHAYIWMN